MQIEDLPVFYQIWNNKTDTWALIHTKTGDFIPTYRIIEHPYDDIPIIRNEKDFPVIDVWVRES